MPRFVQVITKDDPAYIDADKIVSLVFRPELDPPCWVAMTVDQRTFRISEFIASVLLEGSLDDKSLLPKVAA